MKKDIEKLIEAYGEITTLITPSGHEVTIREQTGEDDDILSNAKGVMDGTSTNKFIAGIVVHTDITENGRMNLDTARDLKLCDRYFIIIASRVFSIGQTVKFKYEWPDGLKVDYEEDLGLFIWDYHKEDNPFPVIGDDDYFPERIQQHIGGKDPYREITLNSKKRLKYAFLNGHGERWIMGLKEEDHTVNVGLLARGLQEYIGDKWIKVQNFKTFSPRDMMALRKDVEVNDPPVNLITVLEHPTTHEMVEYPIIASTDFFFPREI